MHSVLISDVTVNIAQACWVLSHVRKENKHTCGSNYIYPPTNVMIVHTPEFTNCMTHIHHYKVDWPQTSVAKGEYFFCMIRVHMPSSCVYVSFINTTCKKNSLLLFVCDVLCMDMCVCLTYLLYETHVRT